MITLLPLIFILFVFIWILLGIIFDLLQSSYKGVYPGCKYTEQQVKALIDRLPGESITSLIDDMVYWLRVRDYCDGITDPHESSTYETARDKEIISRGKQGVNLLIKLLDDSDWLVREEAARLLNEIQRNR
jgi:hypothetical protein